MGYHYISSNGSIGNTHSTTIGREIVLTPICHESKCAKLTFITAREKIDTGILGHVLASLVSPLSTKFAFISVKSTPVSDVL